MASTAIASIALLLLATCISSLTTCHSPLATHYLPLTTCHLLLGTHYLPLTICHLALATHYLPLTTCHSLLGTWHLALATRYTRTSDRLQLAVNIGHIVRHIMAEHVVTKQEMARHDASCAMDP